MLAGIAAGDAVCLSATGERTAGQAHAAAATLLGRVDSTTGKQLQRLVALKPAAHDGDRLPDDRDRSAAQRAARALVENTTRRT